MVSLAQWAPHLESEREGLEEGRGGLPVGEGQHQAGVGLQPLLLHVLREALIVDHDTPQQQQPAPRWSPSLRPTPTTAGPQPGLLLAALHAPPP